MADVWSEMPVIVTSLNARHRASGPLLICRPKSVAPENYTTTAGIMRILDYFDKVPIKGQDK
jgi:hypothetical protein